MLTIYILLSVFAVSLISLIGVFTFSFKEEFLKKAVFVLVGLAAGAFFGNAFLHLIPESFEAVEEPLAVSLFVLAGILLFFVLEKFLHWHHSHDDFEEKSKENNKVSQDQKVKPLGYLVLVSDAIHNFIDGLIVAASFFISVEVGVATTIAIILHEVPQEIADFGLLLHSGMTKLKALLFNFISALFAIVGALVAILASSSFETVSPFVTAFAAGAFIYIAGSDLVPEIHKTRNFGKSLIQFISIILGIVIMFLLIEK
ncbi:MAG: zinc/iron permease [Parcubacteria group bacterium Gr01-1014_107]|nr:MAG: zinc/iron permease [Parcubacteria group bacterium Gr01-1014_107]